LIKVLIVEDDPMVVKFNKYYLEQVGGFELKTGDSSSDAHMINIKATATVPQKL
jgi:CitB family two-component system response regulator MalR